MTPKKYDEYPYHTNIGSNPPGSKPLKEYGLTVNAKKCQFRLPKLTFFGHDLSNKGISPNEEVSAIQNARPPQYTAEVRSLLGIVQYCAKFLPDFTQVAEPLRMFRFVSV